MAPSAIDIITSNYDSLSLKDKDYVETTSVSDYESGADSVKDGGKQAKEMIGAALQKHINTIDPHDCEPGDEDAFFIGDLGEVYRQHMRWKQQLPRITPHFAVKCNPDPGVLRLLANLGAGFDCASKAEIDQVRAMGVDPARIIYANPCKTTSFLRHTIKTGVKQMTFDNTDELRKIKAIYPTAELFLRICTDDSASLCQLSNKFGASMDKVPQLLELAKELDLDVAGVAFHVGSGASDPEAFRKAITDARSVFDQAAKLGYQLHTLDCGGGFSSDTFDDMAAVLSEAVDKAFPSHVRIIAEPGRFYTSSAFTLACNVIARRTVEADTLGGTKSYMLYMNDGVYGNFSSIIFDHQHPVPRILRSQTCQDGYKYSTMTDSLVDSGYGSDADGTFTQPREKKAITYSIWGPTCDGIDCISDEWYSTETLDIGDWLYFEDMGAYTMCSATKFNGFPDKHKTIYVCSEPDAVEFVELYLQE